MKDEVLNKIRKAVCNRTITFRLHAVEMMVERNILRDDIFSCINNGEVIEEYLNDYPLPSYLFCYLSGGQNIHVVLSYDEKMGQVFIITAYRPDLLHFENDLKTRRKK